MKKIFENYEEIIIKFWISYQSNFENALAQYLEI